MIDITFDFRTDAKGKDPDSHSPTLRKYHQFLWSKTLPSGRFFSLDTSDSKRYLSHRSELGEFLLTSDSVIHTYTKWKRLESITGQFLESEKEEFVRTAYTIGGMLVFPGNRVNGMNTINGERGFNSRICDRIDLTLECIRRHYVQRDSPMAPTLNRYSDFFSLFGDFHGYVDYFLLQDLVEEDGASIKFLMPFDDFQTSPVPSDVSSYAEYRIRCLDFVMARNRRIADWVRPRIPTESANDSFGPSN